jgi:hypothetical protein
MSYGQVRKLSQYGNRPGKPLANRPQKGAASEMNASAERKCIGSVAILVGF